MSPDGNQDSGNQEPSFGQVEVRTPNAECFQISVTPSLEPRSAVPTSALVRPNTCRATTSRVVSMFFIHPVLCGWKTALSESESGSLIGLLLADHAHNNKTRMARM